MARANFSWKLVALAAAALAVGGAGFWWLQRHGFNVRLAVEAGLGVLRAGGPWAFFSAMALLPAAGCPISAFYLTAAAAFSEQLGLGGVLAAAAAALAVNIALTYWLARQGLRPTIEEWLSRTRHRIPELAAADHAELTLLLRVTPGPPFFVQSYLLGLAGVRFRPYFWISWVVACAYATGFIIFGEAILHGEARLAITGGSALVAVALIVHFIRRHHGRARS